MYKLDCCRPLFQETLNIEALNIAHSPEQRQLKTYNKQSV